MVGIKNINDHRKDLLTLSMPVHLLMTQLRFFFLDMIILYVKKSSVLLLLVMKLLKSQIIQLVYPFMFMKIGGVVIVGMIILN